MLSKQIPLGIYEKALPAGECWLERLRLAKTLGFDFVEMSVDETDERLSRLGWSRAQVTLAMEIMDYPLMNSISKALGYAHYLNNPWFQLYPDIGNLSAWDNDVQMELQAGIGHIVAVHVKDTKPGVFKNVPFGEGVVDFERCFETLKQSGYCGPYLIEMWSETAEDPAAEVVKARDWVKARMAKAGMVEAA
ncbi:TPA: TIM barrel protein [Escherichia coli]|uniref:TIM barrel protein n=1 Tax=Escherichia coli TaxID=562 RepID=UPI0020255BB2|nr:TIM barrel protein [Escherichia coli]HBB8681743.1 TIM barrel protein [Escherichia coli]